MDCSVQVTQNAWKVYFVSTRALNTLTELNICIMKDKGWDFE